MAAADFIQQILRAAVHVIALQQVAVRSDPRPIAGFTPQRVAGRVRVCPADSLPLLRAIVFALLLRHGLAQIAHAFAHRAHRIGLTVKRARQIAVAQSLFRFFHRPTRLIKRAAPSLSLFGASARKVAAVQAPQTVAQIALAFGQALALTFTSLAGAFLVLALTSLLALALLAILTLLALLPLLALFPLLIALVLALLAVLILQF